VPILAIAPMVVVWTGSRGLPAWGSVAVIAAYLTFFPVTINTMRGLDSADPRALELMRSYASSTWSILWKVKVPASLPFLFTALKVSATASVVGAIIGELPSSIQDGLGGAILNFNQYYLSSPPSLWADEQSIAASLGISFFAIVAIVEHFVVRRDAGARGVSAAAVSLQKVGKTFARGEVTALQEIESTSSRASSSR
jgi:NitT/TauT family transport system permease protein